MHWEAAQKEGHSVIIELQRFYKGVLTEAELKMNLKSLQNPENAEKTTIVEIVDNSALKKIGKGLKMKIKTMHTLKILMKLL